MGCRYIYTNHLLERLEERFGINVHWENKKETYKEINDIMSEASEDRSYLNDSRFMINMYDLHGYDKKYEFRINAKLDIVFVMILERGKKIVKTCYQLDSSRFVKKKKFKKKHKRKQNLDSYLKIKESR